MKNNQKCASYLFKKENKQENILLAYSKAHTAIISEMR